MEKSIYSHEYRVMLQLLKDARAKSGITQVQLAESLGITQSLVSKIERGDRRLDVAELRSVCIALGVTLRDFIVDLENELVKPAP